MIETEKLIKTKDGIDWAKFVGVTLVALHFVPLATLAFERRDIYA